VSLRRRVKGENERVVGQRRGKQITGHSTDRPADRARGEKGSREIAAAGGMLVPRPRDHTYTRAPLMTSENENSAPVRCPCVVYIITVLRNQNKLTASVVVVEFLSKNYKIYYMLCAVLRT